MSRIIDKSKCVACGRCERVCIVGCISQLENKKRRIDPSACVDCGSVK